MRRRLMALLLCAALSISILAAGASAAEAAPVMRWEARRTGDQLTVTVRVEHVSFNAIQFYLAYDASRLEPSTYEGNQPAADGAAMTKLWQEPFDILLNDEGWMEADAALNAEHSVVRYLLYVSPAAAGIAADGEGFYTAEEATDLLTVSFRIKEGATLYTDSVRLGSSFSSESGVSIATREDEGITSSGAVAVDLSAVAGDGPTPGGVAGGRWPDPPKPPAEEGGQTGGGSDSTGGQTTGGQTAENDRKDKPGETALSDIAGNWAEQAINDLLERGVITGYSDGTFRPKNSLTRAEFAIVLARAAGLEAATGASAFPDCAGSWAEGYIAAVTEAGYMKGVGGGSFAPGRVITREETVTVLARMKGVSGGTLTFTDREEISAWAAPSVAGAVAAGLVTGYPDNTFRPRNPVTREEMAKLVSALLAA